MVKTIDRKNKQNPPILLALYAAGFALLHLLALANDWYFFYKWLDIVMHLGGGIFVAWVFAHYRFLIPSLKAVPGWLLWIFGLGSVLLVGVLWEWWELLGEIVKLLRAGIPIEGLAEAFKLPPYNDRWDTLWDLINDTIGAVIVFTVTTLRLLLRKEE